MESSSSRTRFKFRDHQEEEAAALSDATSDVTSVSSDPVDIGDNDDDGEDDSDLQSMTAKGIKHLCSELLELKEASDAEFKRNIFSNYSAFVRIVEEVEEIENGIMKLKNHVFNQKKLVQDLVDGIFPKLLAEDTIESAREHSVSDELGPPSKVKAHIDYVLETLDMLLSENRFDEALDILEMEDENLERLQCVKGSPADDLELYSSVISEWKDELMMKLRLVAGNPRITAAELQQALSRICRLGDGQLATELLLKYYHLRIEAGVHRLQSSSSLPSGVYIRELSKLVFSMMSLAARSFVKLHGETSPYASELIQWARKETKAFASCYIVYIRSISEISTGLSTIVQSLQFAVSFCSLLEAQRLVLRRFLIHKIRPCMEEVLEIYMDHFKKVVAIFTATDSWDLGNYLVSGILSESCSLVLVGDRPECCLLTSSGQKLVTLLQAIAQDVSPLAALEMENSAVKCLTDLFIEYISTTEKVVNIETGLLDVEKVDHKESSTETLMKEISILMNLSTLECLFSRVIRRVLNCKGQIDSSNMDEGSVLDNSFSSIQESLGRVRSCFCRQFISKITSSQSDQRISSEASSDGPSDSVVPHDVKPSIPFQVLFLELRKIRKLVEDVVEVSWMMELFRDMVETTFSWISDNNVISAPSEETITAHHSDQTDEQFILDVQFLLEISKNGGYFSENLEMTAQSTLLSLGLNPERDLNGHDWAITAACQAIEKLLQIDEEELSESEHSDTTEGGETEPCELRSIQEDCLSCVEDSVGPEECVGGIDAAPVATTADVPGVSSEEADYTSDSPMALVERVHLGGEELENAGPAPPRD